MLRPLFVALNRGANIIIDNNPITVIVSEIAGARNFFADADYETQRQYEELRDSFGETLNSTDKEIYYLKEKGYTQAEIATRLGYKSHSAGANKVAVVRMMGHKSSDVGERVYTHKTLEELREAKL